MPLTRYQLRNEFSLADPDLYRPADKDDPEALLEGVAMAGLVGVLRQLGDLAEFAAEIFHDLHEEVMATAARGHGLMVRVQQLEADVPAIEKEFLSRTNHLSFHTNAGVDWHPNLHMEQNLITHGDLPRCVMDSYEECWGPPRLFLLDKFDVAGAGACLKRYTDPSFFKNEMAILETTLEVQREKKMRKTKKRGSRWKNGEMKESLPTSHVKLHQLFLEERIENAFSDPARLVKLKKRQLNGSLLDPTSGKSYMEKFVETPSPDNSNAVNETTINLPLLKWTSDNSSESGLEIVEIRTVPVTTLAEMKEITSVSADAQEMVVNASMENLKGEASNQEIVKLPEPASGGDRNGTLHGFPRVKHENELIDDRGKDEKGDLHVDNSDDMTSEVENFMDALATMESEIDTDNECRPRNDLGFLTDEMHGADSDANNEQFEIHGHSSDSQSFGISYISDDGDTLFRKSQSSFSSSDTVSNVTENVASDNEGATDVYTCAENCAADKVYTSSIQLPEHAEIQGSNSNEIDEDQLCDTGEAPSTSCLADTNHTSTEMDPRASTVIVLPVEHEVNEEPSDDDKLSSDVFNTNKNGFNITHSSELVSIDLPQKSLVFCGNPQHVGDKNITSDALMHRTKILEPDLHSENGDNCLDEVHRIDLVEEDCGRNSGNVVAGSPELVVMATMDLVPCSTLPEAEACSDMTVLANKLDDVMPAEPVSELDATMKAWIESVNVVELVDPSLSHKKNEQLSDAFCYVPQEEAGDSNLEQKPDLDEVSRAVDDEETGESSGKVDDMERSPVALDATATCQDGSADKDHVHFDDPSTEVVRSDGDAVSMTVTIGSDSGNQSSNSIHSVLRDPMVSGKCPTAGRHRYAPEFTEKPSPRSLIESGGQHYEVEAPAVDSDSTEIMSASFDFYNLKGNVTNSAQDGQTGDGPGLGEVGPVPSSDQYGELNVLPLNHLWESSENVTPSPSCYLSEPGTCLEQSLDLPTDQLDAESVPRDEASRISPGVLALSFDQGFDSNKLEMDSLVPLPSTYTLHTNGNNARADEMPPLPPLPPMQWRMGKVQQYSLASQRRLAEYDEGLFPIVSQCTTEPEAQYEFSVSEVGSLLPWQPYLSATSEEEKQHRESEQIIGDCVQPTLGLPKRPNISEEQNIQCSGSSFEKTQSSNLLFTEPEISNERYEYGSPAFEGGVQSSKAALPLLIVEDTNPRHEFSSLLENPIQTSCDLLMHTTLEGASFKPCSQEYKALVENYLDTTVTPPSTFQEQPPSRVEQQPPKGVKEQAPNRVEEQPSNQVEEQTPNKIEELPQNEEHPSDEVNEQLPSEFEEETPKKVQQQAPEDIEEQPCAQVEAQLPPEAEKQSEHGVVTSGGEIPPMFNAFALPGLSTSETFFPPHSLALLPMSEAGKDNANPTVKLPRPRNPLIDAVAAVDKSKLRKVTDRLQPPIGHKLDKRDSLLEQIRTKSFNLKPAVVTRPSIQNIQGPKTNLRLAAILEKANTIRQATAGSDEDDEDSWSDS